MGRGFLRMVKGYYKSTGQETSLLLNFATIVISKDKILSIQYHFYIKEGWYISDMDRSDMH